MARFAVGQPIATSEPVIVVDPGLAPGLHRFRLEVFNGSGVMSPPDEVVVRVLPRLPVPVRPIGGGVLRDGRDT